MQYPTCRAPESAAKGQLAMAGVGAKARAMSAARPETRLITVIDHSRSAPDRSSTFQVACSRAEPRTSAMISGGTAFTSWGSRHRPDGGLLDRRVLQFPRGRDL